MFRKLIKTQKMAPGTPALIIASVGMTQALVLDLGKMDRTVEGTIDAGPGNSAKCIWLNDGRRVEVEVVKPHGFLASVSQDPDPLYPNRKV